MTSLGMRVRESLQEFNVRIPDIPSLQDIFKKPSLNGIKILYPQLNQPEEMVTIVPTLLLVTNEKSELKFIETEYQHMRKPLCMKLGEALSSLKI